MDRRIEENLNDAFHCYYYLYSTVYEYGHGKVIWTNSSPKEEKTYRAGCSAVSVLPWKGKQKEKIEKKSLQHGVFVFGHPTK